MVIYSLEKTKSDRKMSSISYYQHGVTLSLEDNKKSEEIKI